MVWSNLRRPATPTRRPQASPRHSAGSSGCPLHRFAYRRYDVVGVRPGSAQELGEESALSRNDLLAVDDDVELAPPSLLEFNVGVQSSMDVGSETRCLFGRCTSPLTVDYSDVHSVEYSSLLLLQANAVLNNVRSGASRLS